MYLLFVVKNDGVGSYGFDSQRIERIIEYDGLIVRVNGLERAIHHWTSCQRAIVLVRARGVKVDCTANDCQKEKDTN